jgi:hypothetical protein
MSVANLSTMSDEPWSLRLDADPDDIIVAFGAGTKR